MVDNISAITQLKARQLRAMDTKDWDGMRQTFADDLVMDFTELGGALTSGADEFVATVRASLDGVVSVHQVFMPEIVVTSPHDASGIWTMQVVQVLPDWTRTIVFGHYHETDAEIDGSWLIKSSRLSRVHAETIS